MDDRIPPAAEGRERRAEIRFLRRVLILAAVVVTGLFLWAARGAVLLAFGATVVAVLLLAASRPFQRHLGLSRGWSLLAGGGTVLGVLLLIGTLVGGEVRSQVTDLGARLPDAARSLERRLGINLPDLGQAPAEEAGDSTSRQDAPAANGPIGVSDLSDAVQQIAAFGVVLIDDASALVLALVGGIYLAASPNFNRRGLVALVPKAQQGRLEDLLETCGRALHGWLLATLISMAAVGVLVGLGTWMIGLPAPVALGLFAAVTEFVPIIGPFVGAVPALLLALGQGGGTDGGWLGSHVVLWTALLFLVVQQVESNLIAPQMQRRMAEVPPVLLLFAVVAIGAVFGLAGVVLAAPLTVVGYVAVQKLYVRQTLGEPAKVPGESSPGPEPG
jgi:predicted PurR-regulated permease PerM